MKPKMSSSDRISLERLRDSVVRARRWHHSQIGALDALWLGQQTEIAAAAPSQRAVRLELLRRQILKLTASVPPSVFSPEPDPAPLTDTTQPPGDNAAS